MVESALKFLQDALVHLDKMIEQEKNNLFETERKLEEVSFETDRKLKEISRNIEQYEKEKILVSEAIQQFLGKGI